MATAPSAEARELSLLDRVELKLALADSEAKLQNILNIYLTPLLLKLASEHVTVRNKVISICQHINTRTKSQYVLEHFVSSNTTTAYASHRAIRLPVAELLQQFKDQPNNLIRHFDLLYVQQGISRYSAQEQAALFPALASGFASIVKSSAAHGSVLFNLLLRTLFIYRFPLKGTKEAENLRTDLGLSDDDVRAMALWFEKLLLLKINRTGPPGEERCPGLTEDEYSFLTVQSKPDVWDSTKEQGLNLTDTKSKVLGALSTSLFKDDERLMPLLCASADPNSTISDTGEDQLKRALPEVSLNDSTVLDRLFEMYLGTPTMNDEMENSVRSAVRAPVRIKILSVLSRTEKSTTRTSEIMRIVERDFIHGDDSSGQGRRMDRETSKLRSAIVSYLTFVARNGSQEDLDILSRSVIENVRNFIDDQKGVPQNELDNITGRSFEVIGLLAHASDSLVVDPDTDLALLRWLFDHLAEEVDKAVVFSIDEAIAATMRSFQKRITPDVENSLRDLLLNNMLTEPRNARNVHFTSLRFANRCLAYNDVVARWIDILAVGQPSGASHEVNEEATKGLDPYWNRLLNEGFDNTASEAEGKRAAERSGFPKFSEVVSYMFSNTQSAALDNLDVYSLALSYGRQMLMREALQTGNIALEVNTEWQRKLDLAVAEDWNARQSVRQYLGSIMSDSDERESLLNFWNYALKGLQSEHVNCRRTSAKIVMELCSLGPELLITNISKDFKRIEKVVFSNDAEIRDFSAQAYGLLASHPSTASDVLTESKDLLLEKVTNWQSATGSDLNKTHGAILALAFFVSRRLYRVKDDTTAQEVLQSLLPSLFNIIEKSSESTLQEAAYTSLGQLSLYYAVAPQQITEHMSFATLVEKLKKKALQGNEKAILALGNFSMILEEDESENLLDLFVTAIHDLHEIRQAESQFAVGEAMCCLAAGWNSKALSSKVDVDGPLPSGPARSKTLETMVDRVVSDCAAPKPALRKAAVIWLLCFIQFCGHREEIQSRLGRFQAAFKRCLSDRDDLVQETASRGLGLVYEQGSRDVKDDLVRDLVSSFSSNRAETSGTVTAETQLFEPGALPTGDGSVTTYKDIMNLAHEVGDSSLVYRFMSLASNNAIWSSRAAFGRFGLSNVLSDSSVDGYLANNPRLYPKLFRYKFDPNPNVRRSMNDIWNALVKDSSKTIEGHFNAIMDDLLVSIVDREWRVRQASCAAISDVVQGRKMEQVRPYLDRIWAMSFKVLDDIKESVRAAAATLARTMTGILQRSLEAPEGSTSAATEMLGQVIPFLFSTSGLESGAEEVQAFSLRTLLQIIKKGRERTLRPFVPDLIERLLGLLTFLEPQEVNYLHLNASKYNLSELDIDKARLSHIRASPLMESVDRCIDLLDEATLKQLSPRLQSVMKTAVGMPSKVGCSRALVSLSTRRTALFRPFADTFMRAMEKQVMDRNDTVCSSYAAALGYVARSASEEQLLKTANFVKSMYFDAEVDRNRLVAAEVVQAIGKYATDRFNSVASAYMPLIFIGRQDEKEEVKALFQDVWDDNAGGPRAASLYLDEIVSLTNTHLDSRQWNVKHTAARATSEAVKAVAASKSTISEMDGQKLWPPLKKALAEKSWDGKEQILEGFVSFVKNGEQYWVHHSDVAGDITKIATREARRRNAGYRIHAIATLGQIAAARPDVDMWSTVHDIVSPVISELLDVEASDKEQEGQQDASEKGSSARESEAGRIRGIAEAINALFDALCVPGKKPRSEATDSVDGAKAKAKSSEGGVTPAWTSFAASVAASLDLSKRAFQSCPHSNPILTAIYTNIRRLLQKLIEQGRNNVARIILAESQTRDAFSWLLFGPSPTVDLSTSTMPERLRLLRAEALLTFAKALSLAELSDPTALNHYTTLESLEPSVQVRQLLSRGRQLLLQRPDQAVAAV